MTLRRHGPRLRARRRAIAALAACLAPPAAAGALAAPVRDAGAAPREATGAARAGARSSHLVERGGWILGAEDR